MAPHRVDQADAEGNARGEAVLHVRPMGGTMGVREQTEVGVHTEEIRLDERQRPLLFYDAGEIQTIRELTRQEGSFQHRRYQAIVRDTDTWLRRPLPIPDKNAEGKWLGLYICPADSTGLIYDPHEPHRHTCPKCGKVHTGGVYDQTWRAYQHAKIAGAAEDLALRYAVGGDVRYAEAAAAILCEYADRYDAYPIEQFSKVGSQTLEDGFFALHVASAYDLILDSGALGGEQQRHVAEDLLLATARLIGSVDADIHEPLPSNWQALCTAAIGVIGFALRSEELVDFAINGPVGFNALMERCVREDGLFWEGSIGYAIGTIGDVLCLTEAAWHSGIDLYRHPRVRGMFAAPVRIGFADGTYPAVGDDYFGRSLAEVFGTLAEVYYARTRDQEVLPLLVAGRVSEQGERARGLRRGYVAPLWLTPVWQPPARPPVRESVNFPASGYAILRACPEGSGAEEVQLLLQYGPHGGGHGHLDKLNVVLYANGRVQAPDLGICNYSLAESQGWYRQTVSHNTVVVDQVSQHRIGGKLERFEVSPRVQMADASAHDYQHGVRMRRTVILVDGAFVVDLFRVGGAGPNRQRGRRMDWVYRNFGELQVSAELVEHEKALGEDNGYQHIRDVRRGSADETWTATFESEGQGVRLTMLGEAGTEVIAATAPGTTLDERLDVLFARRQAPPPHARTRYLTVLEPFRGQPAISGVRELTVSREHRGLDSEAAGLAVQRGSGTVYVAVSYAWKPVPTRYGELTTDGALVVLCAGDGGALEYLYAVETTRVEWGRIECGGFALRADSPLTLHLERGDGAEYLLENLSDRDGTVTIEGIGRAEAPLAVSPRSRRRIVPG